MAELAKGTPHHHNRRLQSGRQVLASARPRGDGGDVMTFADVSGLLTKELALQFSLNRAESRKAELDQRLSEAKREKQQVEERQSKLKRMLLVATHTTDMIIIADANDKAEWVNGACTALFETAESQLIKRDIVNVIAGECADKMTKAACLNAVPQRG